MRFFVSFNWLLTITQSARSHSFTHIHTRTQCPIRSNHSILQQRISFVTHKLCHSTALNVSAVECPNVCLLSVRIGSYATIFCRIHFSTHFVVILFIPLPQTYTCFECFGIVCGSLSLSHRAYCRCSHLGAPVETTFDTIFTNITVLSFVSAISILFWGFILKKRKYLYMYIIYTTIPNDRFVCIQLLS